MRVPQLAVKGLLGDDNGASLNANAATGADANEYGIHTLGMVHQLDQFVQQDANRGRSHAVTDAKHWTNFVHGVAVRVSANVLQLGASRELITDLVHDEVCKVLHALWCPAHANELVGIMNKEWNSFIFNWKNLNMD